MFFNWKALKSVSNSNEVFIYLYTVLIWCKAESKKYNNMINYNWQQYRFFLSWKTWFDESLNQRNMTTGLIIIGISIWFFLSWCSAKSKKYDNRIDYHWQQYRNLFSLKTWTVISSPFSMSRLALTIIRGWELENDWLIEWLIFLVETQHKVYKYTF